MIKEKILCAISEVFDIEKSKLSENPSSEEIETWDSLKQILLIETLESKFLIQFKAEEFGKLLDLNSIERIISAKLGHRQ